MRTNASLPLRCRQVTPEGYRRLWENEKNTLYWPSPFALPSWQEAWWRHFAGGYSHYYLLVHNDNRCLGVAPLMRNGGEVRLLGDKDLCDHLDCSVDAKHAAEFYGAVLQHLRYDDAHHLILEPLRPDSSIMRELLPIARQQGHTVAIREQDALFAMKLPSSWQDYLSSLRSKERHEIRRKIRRLDEAGPVQFRCITQRGEIEAAMPTFLRLFTANMSKKKAFMSESMGRYFVDLASGLGADNLLKLYFLDLAGSPIAAVFCIDYRGAVYLYNNGYDSSFRHLSAGLLSKVFSIRESIETGSRVYDFLKGAERYKERLGGQPVSISRAVVELQGRG